MIQKLKKAELHLHLEGSLEPQMMFDLAQRNKVRLQYSSVDEVQSAYKFSCLQDFLNMYYQGMSVLKTRQDFFDLALAYFTKAHQNNVSHAEVFIDPQAHLNRGVLLQEIFGGISEAIAVAKQVFDLNVSIIVCFLRDLGQDAALKIFDELMPYRDQFIGIGLDSEEHGYPPSQFKALFDRARKEKLHLVSHAGEEAPAQYIWEAIDVLGVERIDHGNTVITDDVLIARVAKDKIPLTMCPLSNLCLGVIDSVEHHPVRTLLERGVMVTINSDDPAYFGGYINDNYDAVINALQLSDLEVQTLVKNSLEAKFV